MKIVTIIGARPQFIKASVLSLEFSKDQSIQEIIVHTGQHFDHNMSKIFFEEMMIPTPKYNLGVQNLSHGAMTGRQLEKVEEILLKEKPDFVLVYGDTNSTLAGALAAVKIHIPVIHVESGLRSFNRKMPEEINRLLTDHIATILFVPSEVSFNNLIKEGIDKKKIFNVGDIMFDSTLYFSKKADHSSKILDKLGVKKKNYILTTIHRPENTDSSIKLNNIFDALSSLNTQVIIPIHPRTKIKVSEYECNIGKNIKLINPVGFFDMIILEKNASKIATDSGGIQKEAFFYGVPCITIRDQTEWVELLDIGANILCGANINDLKKALTLDLKPFEPSNVYGSGNTANKIRKILKSL
tara:strand:- start:11002 stop:12066 length:1065 start_codon:yes stop_codon:yes gene_type:complete